MVSIIIPIYKAENYIEECLASILNQTYTDFEVLCINDGSPDNSAAICQHFVKIDNRFQLINQKNEGVSSARNNGLNRAKGEYIYFIDADDAIAPNYLEELVRLSKDGSMAICSYARNKRNLTKKTTKIQEYGVKEYINHVLDEDIEHPNIWSMLFRNSIIQAQQLYFHIGCIKNEDTEFYLKYMVHEKNIVFSNFKGYYYRVNENSAVHKPISIKSLTSIEAQKRISVYLYNHGIIKDIDRVLGASIQVYSFISARESNRQIYNVLHQHYNVKKAMKAMLDHPRFGRKLTSILYLLLGKNVFYTLLSRV